MNRHGVVAVAITAVLGLAAVAGVSMAMSGRPGTGVKPESDRYRCFNPTFVRSFQTPSDSKLIIVSDENQAYELSMAGPCIGLDSSFAIGIRSRTPMSEVCDAFDADIVFRDDGIESHRECRIMSVRHLTGDEAAKYIDAPRNGHNSANDHSNRSGSDRNASDRGNGYRGSSASDSR